MMNTIQFISGRGWLIFSGGDRYGSEIRAKALARAKTYGASAYISFAEDGGDSLMDDLEDLGARSGYFVDLQFDSPEEIEEGLKTSSFIVIEPGTSLDEIHEAIQGSAARGIHEAYERGAVILVEGLAGNLFGRWVVTDSGEIEDGLNWIQNVFLEPEASGAEDSRAVQIILSSFEDAIAISVGQESAFVIGGGGQIELWGDPPRVTVSLGRGFSVNE